MTVYVTVLCEQTVLEDAEWVQVMDKVSSHLYDGLQQVQYDEVRLCGQVPADQSLLVQLCFSPDGKWSDRY